MAEVIRPALARGDDVVSDRFTGSTLAYQGFARGLPVEELAWLSSWATGGLEPDLVVLLDVPASVAVTRMKREPDRMESAGDAFHRAGGGAGTGRWPPPIPSGGAWWTGRAVSRRWRRW